MRVTLSIQFLKSQRICCYNWQYFYRFDLFLNSIAPDKGERISFIKTFYYIVFYHHLQIFSVTSLLSDVCCNFDNFRFHLGLTYILASKYILYKSLFTLNPNKGKVVAWTLERLNTVARMMMVNIKVEIQNFLQAQWLSTPVVHLF